MIRGRIAAFLGEALGLSHPGTSRQLRSSGPLASQSSAFASAKARNAAHLRSLRRVRGQGPRPKGFTLLELMMVLVVLTIVSTAVMSRVGLQTVDSAFRKYSADVVDSFLKARARAIDEQTRVFLTMQPDGVDVEWIDPDTGLRELMWLHREKRYGGGVMAESTCNGGLYNGVVAPGETRHESTFACITTKQELVFYPDGSFGFSAAAGAPAGVTAILARQEGAGKIGTVIEVYPGGNIRKLDNVSF